MGLPDSDRIAELLVSLGCPLEKSSEMAVQLQRRAVQLAPTRNEKPEQTLVHLLKLMAGGWASPVALDNPSTGAGQSSP